jgi:transposase-like protein
METIGSSAPYFSNVDKAREYLEELRWPNGPVCPHCGGVDGHYPIQPKVESKKPARKGLWKCSKCRKQFSVTIGTVFESSHIPLHKWLMATYFLCASKKGMSCHQLHRMLGVTYKTAWFISHRIRYACNG